MAATPETKKDRVKTLNNTQEKRKQDCKTRVETALEKMTAEGIKINFSTVAKEANVSVSYLYKYDDIKARITKIRNKQLSTPKLELAASSIVKSQQKMIARLKDKIKRQDEDIKQLKQVNETLAGSVDRITELESFFLWQKSDKKEINRSVKMKKMTYEQVKNLTPERFKGLFRVEKKDI